MSGFAMPRLEALVRRALEAPQAGGPDEIHRDEGPARAVGPGAARSTGAVGAGAAMRSSEAVGAGAALRAPEAVPAAAGAPMPSTGTAPACDLCSEPLGPRHAHLVDLREQALRCVCRACAILFDRQSAGGAHYRLVPDRVRLLEDFTLADMHWIALRIPVDLVFLFHSSAAGRVVALYPGPMGATESLLGLDHWERLVADNPALSEIEPDVEALLVDRTGGKRDGWIVPIDACYELTGLFRMRWKGLSGGTEVWEAIDEFFEDLRRRARVGGRPTLNDQRQRTAGG